MLNTWRQEQNERSLFAAEDGSVSQHVHSLHHGSPMHDIMNNNSISAILFPCYNALWRVVVCGTWNSSKSVPLKISTARLQMWLNEQLSVTGNNMTKFF